MALNFPGLFPPTPPLRTVFEWVDIVSGLGYVSFDLGSLSSTDNSVVRVLMPSDSAVRATQGSESPSTKFLDFNAWSSTSYVTMFDLDFDTSAFLYPRIIRGDVLLQFSICVTPNASLTPHMNLVVKINKWADPTETVLATYDSTGDDFDNYAATGSEFVVDISLRIPVAETLFKVGEKLRINIILKGKNASGTDTCRVTLGGDPSDRNFTYTVDTPNINFPAGKTRARAFIPFKLDI